MSGRKLTNEEITYSKFIFGDSIKYNDVLVYGEKFAFFQADNTGMTPNGNIYLHGKSASDNYGVLTLPPALRSLFIHEMAHVWQKQNNILNPVVSAVANALRHALFYSEAYKYKLVEGKDLLEYRMEQQAQIIEDYTRINFLHISISVKYIQNKEDNSKILQLFAKVLSKFIENPSYPSSTKK